MSEKRFIKLKSEWVDINFPIIWDTCNETGLNVEQAVNWLNELYREMKRFGEHNYKLEQYNLHYLKENTRLKEENEQLRKELKEIKENPINYF